MRRLTLTRIVGQGQALRQFYNSQGSFDDVGLGGKPGTLDVGFANAGGIQYCDAIDCSNDGNEYTRSGLAKCDLSLTRRSAGGYYKLSNGGTFWAPGGAEAGDIVWTPKSYNKTMSFEMSQTHVFDPSSGLERYDYMQFNMYTDRAEVVGSVDASTA